MFLGMLIVTVTIEMQYDHFVHQQLLYYHSVAKIFDGNHSFQVLFSQMHDHV